MNASFLKRTAWAPGLMLVAILFSSCLKDKQAKEVVFTANVPIYMTYDELQAAVQVGTPTQYLNRGN